MIDYEISVDVSNADIETKKKVQDAFFRLGITWLSGDGYACLDPDKGYYTNTLNTGKVTQGIMWAGVGHVGHKEPTHTIRELLELAGMKPETDLKPFDLEKALAGEPVVLRNGQIAYVRHQETEIDMTYPIIGIKGGSKAVVASWTVGGDFLAHKKETPSDIVGMWSEPLAFEHWNLLAEKVTHLAKDSDDYWYGYGGKPTKDEERWDAPCYGGCYSVAVINPKLFPECNWKTSLMERPDNG